MMLVWHRLNAAGTAYEAQGIIEDAYAVVWTERWQDYGEAQVDLPPTHDVRTGDLVTMPERDMAAEVVGRTETERGVQLRCRDALSILDRRIVYPTVSNNGLVKTFVEKLLANDGIVGPTNPWDRTLRPVSVGDMTAISGSANIQRSYGQVGETLLEVARASGFDPTCRLSGGLLVVGARANGVQRVWGIGRRLSGYTEDVDMSEARNVAYVGGQEHGGTREVVPVLDEEDPPANMDRREMFVDRRDIPFDGMDYASAVDYYGAEDPNQTGTVKLSLEVGAEGPTVTAVETVYHERATLEKYVSVNQYMGTDKLTQAVALHPWSAVTFMQFGDNVTATISKGSTQVQFVFPANVFDDCLYRVQMYSYRFHVLWRPGEEALADLQPETAFEATTEGLTPYVDYALGDQVAIYKADGGRKDMRVVEVVESWDSQGYRATPGLASL